MNESDWKLFRTLQPTLLNRLCEQILQECAQVIGDETKSPHERYLDLFGLINDRDQDVGRCFDAPSRSNLTLKLLAIHRLGLLEPAERAWFSADAQEFFERWDRYDDEG